MQTSELKKKGINAVFWNLSGTLMKQGVSFVISIFLARLLSPADFGLVGMATVFIALTQSFTDFGMTSALIQKKEPTATQYNTVFYINLGLSVVLMLLMIACSGYIADYYNNPEVGRIARFVSYSFVINAINGVQNAQLTKALANKVKTLASLSSSIVSGVVGISLAFMGLGVWALIYGTLAGSLVSTAVIWYNSKWRPQLMFSFPEVKPLLGYGVNIFSIGLLDIIYSKLDVLIIGKLFSASTLGLFFKAKSFNELITKYGASPLAGVLFPIFSHLQEDFARVKDIAQKVMHLNSFITFAVMGILYLVADDLIILLFSEKWAAAVPYFKILVFSSYAYSIRIVLFNILNGIGRAKVTLRLELIVKITGFCALLIGFTFGGVEGYLWTLAVMTLFTVIVIYVFVQKEIGWSWLAQFSILLRYAVSSAIIVAVLHTIFIYKFEFRIFSIVVNIVVFSLSYVTTHYILRSSGLKYSINILKPYFREYINK